MTLFGFGIRKDNNACNKRFPSLSLSNGLGCASNSFLGLGDFVGAGVLVLVLILAK